MRFSTLLYKELRECLPWMLLAAIVLLTLGSFFLREQIHYRNPSWYYSRLSPGTIVESHLFTYSSILGVTGPLLLLSSIGLGLVLGIRHFWIPNFTRTWPFLLHRSVRRKTILTAKLVATTIAFVLCLGPVWIGLYWYACRSTIFPTQTLKNFIEGWIFIILGLVTYLGTALSGLSSAKWYTTKIFGLVFAAVVIFMTFPQCSLFRISAVIAASAAILLSQIFQIFGRREF